MLTWHGAAVRLRWPQGCTWLQVSDVSSYSSHLDSPSTLETCTAGVTHTCTHTYTHTTNSDYEVRWAVLSCSLLPRAQLCECMFGQTCWHSLCVCACLCVCLTAKYAQNRAASTVTTPSAIRSATAPVMRLSALINTCAMCTHGCTHTQCQGWTKIDSQNVVVFNDTNVFLRDMDVCGVCTESAVFRTLRGSTQVVVPSEATKNAFCKCVRVRHRRP